MVSSAAQRVGTVYTGQRDSDLSLLSAYPGTEAASSIQSEGSQSFHY